MYLDNRPLKPRATFLFAHGAGAPMDSPFMEEIARLLVLHDIAVVRFEFPYMAQRRIDAVRRPPDRQDRLLASWRQVIQAHSRHQPLYIGGKSMGGRMATLVACEDLPVLGVVCLGYPFHPPGKPDRLRTAHFSDLHCPALIVQGERDPFGGRQEVEGYALPAQVRLCWVAGGNHDFEVPRKAGGSKEQNMIAACEAVAGFMQLA